MKTIGFILLGAILGFVAGLLLSEIIAIIGLVATGEVQGIRYLALITAVLGAGLAGWRAAANRRKKS